MVITLPLDEMSVKEKLNTMESLWEDLCSRAGVVTSPPWHGDVLAEREAAVQNGEDHFEDWETTKRNIKQHIR